MGVAVPASGLVRHHGVQGFWLVSTGLLASETRGTKFRRPSSDERNGLLLVSLAASLWAGWHSGSRRDPA